MARTRSRNVSLTWPINRKFILPTGVVTSDVGTTHSVDTTEIMSDTLTPGYFSKRRRGQFLQVNPMSHTKYAITASGGGSVTWARRGRYAPFTDFGTCVMSGDLAKAYHWGKTSVVWPAWSGGLPSWADENTLMTEALASARSRGFDVLTFFLEWHKTVELIRGFQDRVFKRADRITTHLERNFKFRTEGQFRDFVSVFAETWLEVRYGWRILYYDVESINEAVSRLQSLHTHLIRDSAQGTNSASRTLFNNASTATLLLKTSPSVAGTNVLGIGYLKQDLERRVRAGCLLEAVVGDVLSVDPLVSTWEVIPFSFIVDWFLNVGSTIEAFSPFANETLLGAWVSKAEVLRTYAMFAPRSGNITTTTSETWTVQGGAGSTVLSETEQTTYERYLASPSANLSFNLKLDSLKLADLLALFMGRYLGIVRRLQKLNRG